MTTKNQIFTSVISGSLMITSEKLVGSENYLSWSASVELWFMGQGYEDHLVTQEADIPEVDRVQWRKIDAQLCSVLWKSVDPKILLHLQPIKLVLNFGLRPKDYTRMISSVFIRWLLLLSISTNRTWIYLLILLDKFFMVLTLIGLRPDLEPIRDQILGSSSVPSLDDVFARLFRISSTQTLSSDSASDSSVLVSQTTSRGGRSGTRGRGQRPHCTYCNKLGHTRDRCYQLHGRPPRTAHMAQSSDSPLPQPPSSSASQTSQASIASVAQPGNASACLTQTSSLGPWILDSRACDHLSGNKDLFSSITTTSALPTVTLANGSQTVAKGQEYGKTIGIGRESQGLYHLTSDSSPAVCISTDASLLIHNRLGHPSLSKFQKMVPRFSTLSSLPCESCQLGKHTRVSFPKRLNNRAKFPFELVHTDVWGPCRIAFTLGFQYFVTFIDDYSRSQFTSFMSHHGILHQSSCAHTPQKNGGDAVLTACYLINRMPSSVLHDQIPHSLLFPDQPLYFLPPRVFGCTCFVHILTPGQDKLSAKAMKCLFLGYSRLQKGYRCYSLETHQYFISADVTFFEDSPFFSTTSESLPISEVLPIPIVSPPDAMPLDHFRFIIVALVSLLLSLFLRHLLTHFLSLRLHLPRLCLLLMTYPLLFRKSTHEALSHPGWRQAMVDEMAALHSNGTWDLVVYPLLLKGYTQVYGSDYGDTFSPVAKIASVRLLLSMATMCSWPLYQLDIKNVFLHGDLAEEVYRSNLLVYCSGGVWFSVQVTPFSIWLETISSSMCIYLVVYVDDIVITGSDQDAQSSSGVVLSQRKYALDILEETGMLDCKPVDTPMDPNVKLVPGQGEPLGDPGRYRRLVDAYWAGSPTNRRSTSGYCVFIGGNLISWKSKKQDVVARSSAEAEYRAMALTTCELIWLRHLLRELRFGKDEQMKLICDNQAALHIASNPVFHERTKHIEVDCYFIREKIASGCVATSFVNSKHQDVLLQVLLIQMIN
ncbi:Retrovirus-related Pol polyprotein from transposon RE2 [Vitis vinifera]|uniref:Retrovirus-related Pol polyprotein from transposon RE2 n=1 Tax=Vitis vinifera TaxID=29760 RepID=A0A438JIV1_VITVI|nr:Retrovirus-related Pol polyprotein from transposon RE2 [Vitis vinifera]